MEIVTINEVIKALEKKLNMTTEEAKKTATFILDLFGFDDRILDNILDPAERKLFYRLEAEGLVSSTREEIVLHNGQCWRIHYWILQKQTILKCVNGKERMIIKAKKKPMSPPEPYPENTVYHYLSTDTWTTRKLPSA